MHLPRHGRREKSVVLHYRLVWKDVVCCHPQNSPLLPRQQEGLDNAKATTCVALLLEDFFIFFVVSLIIPIGYI